MARSFPPEFKKDDVSLWRSLFLACAGFVLFSLLFQPLPARAQDVGQELKKLEQKAAQGKKEAEKLSQTAKKLDRELSGLQGQLIAAASKIQNYESDLTAIEETLFSLVEEETLKSKKLLQDKERLSSTLSALQRIALLPPEALAAAPGSPVDTVRSAMLLQVAVPEIEKRVLSLRQDLNELTDLRQRIEEERTALLTSREDLNRERDGLNILIKRKQTVQSQTLSSQKSVDGRVKQLAQQAKDMKDLVARLEEDKARLAALAPRPKARPAPPPVIEESAPPSQASAQGTDQIQTEKPAEATGDSVPTQLAAIPDPTQIRDFPSRQKRVLLPPARGKMISLYGQKKGTNITFDKGVVIATRPAAQVIAPYDGRIAYAGDFRGYGRILIIEHSGRYHTLLAGVERIDVAVGQWVLAGEPVARMGDGTNEQAEIYFELRSSGQPINPSPWLLSDSNTSNLNKVNG
ncbi:peptidoglycan DD-metalloendopeptidase family protein [Kiloniella laminariae]|uniref:Peptidoglycan DD-metalloendopeptidase family protein n=1 Tax=Kiloniella laminariae TaxID=454162 RepID=A0ABT4LN19_9PROT|nr:peptidoglycan DD-metalloendopeptidase family protein [Kiloniella laminariae]MCZ4282479.1 peptidoglycan DD-metalloendopeptidase family protein [Kiloniella laminariae]